MADWIRKSNKYGVEIFESVEEVAELSDNSVWADLRDRHLSVLKLRRDDEIDRLAHKYEIPIGKGADYQKIRKAVAEKLANEDNVKMQAGRLQAIKEQEASAILIKQFASSVSAPA